MIIFFLACQSTTLPPPTAHPPPVSFSYAVQYPPRYAGTGSIQIDGDAPGSGTVTLSYAAQDYIHVRPLSGATFTTRVHYRWSGALPEAEAVALMDSLSVAALAPAIEGEPTLTLHLADGTVLAGAAGEHLTPTLEWLEERQERYTPAE